MDTVKIRRNGGILPDLACLTQEIPDLLRSFVPRSPGKREVIGIRDVAPLAGRRVANELILLPSRCFQALPG